VLEVSTAVSKEPLYIFHHEKPGLNFADDARKLTKQEVSRIILDSLSVSAEPLATWPASDKVDVSCSRDLEDFFRRQWADVIAERYSLGIISRVRPDRIRIEVESESGTKSAQRESGAETTSPAK
jgi:hypothetical protein